MKNMNTPIRNRLENLSRSNILSCYDVFDGPILGKIDCGKCGQKNVTLLKGKLLNLAIDSCLTKVDAGRLSEIFQIIQNQMDQLRNASKENSDVYLAFSEIMEQRMKEDEEMTAIPDPKPVQLNAFDTLPDEIIQDHIAHNFDPKTALLARLVNRRFAALFGDTDIWRVYYRALGLEPPKVLPNTGPFSLSQLAQKLPLWTSLQAAIEAEVKEAGDNVYRQKSPRSLCIAVLTIPELLPLHGYAIKILEQHCSVPSGLSADEVILSAARGDGDFGVNEGARILALRWLAMRSADPKAREALISIITNLSRYVSNDESFCSEAVKGLVPYLNDPEVQRAVSIGLQLFGPHAVRGALDPLIPNPDILDAVVDKFSGGLCGLNKIVRNHLNNPDVVTQLMWRLSIANESHIVSELVQALMPVSYQEPVQQAFCGKLLNLGNDRRDHGKWALKKALTNAPLTNGVIEAYRDLIPLVNELAPARVIIDRAKDLVVNCVNEQTPPVLTPMELDTPNIVSNRQELLSALSNPNEFMRIAAATALAPFVADDPDVLAAFLKRIYVQDFGKVGLIVVSALAKVKYREDICMALIKGGALTGELDSSLTLYNSDLRLATVRTLRQFIDKQEVRDAFLKRLRYDEDPTVRCTLIDILAPQLECEDVRTLFLEAAQDKLWRQSYCSGTEWQVAAIDKLGSVIDRRDVEKVLLQLASTSSYAVKAACTRALCARQQKPRISPGKILIACTDSSHQVREEARQVLVRWATEP